jgi:hypothetical protein
MGNRIIISESEKNQILNLYKPVISEEIRGTSYFTENPQKIYFGANTSYEYIDIKKGTEFKKADGGATAFGGSLKFSCKPVGTVKFENGTGNKNYSYKGKQYWNDALTKKLNSVFCQSKSNLSTGCVKGDCNNGQGTLIKRGYVDGESTTYTGSFKNGKYNGKGKYVVSSGDYYVGDFGDGYKSGYGEYYWSDGKVYKGQWKNDEFNGYGEFTDSRSIFKGQWKDHLRNGYAESKYKDGSIHKGQWKNNEFNGYGIYKNIKGIEFSGNWVDGELNGKTTNDLDKLDQPMTSPESNPVNNKPQVASPVGDDVNSPQDVKGFQDWLDLNHSGWTTNKPYQTLDKKDSRGYGKYGPLTKAAWASYKDEYLQSKPKPEVETPAETPVSNPTEIPNV